MKVYFNNIFNVLLTPFIVYLYINWLQMYTSKQGQEALSELVSNLLDAIDYFGILKALGGSLDIDFVLYNLKSNWTKNTFMWVIGIDFASKCLIFRLHNEVKSTAYYPNFGTAELVQILEQLEQYKKK